MNIRDEVLLEVVAALDSIRADEGDSDPALVLAHLFDDVYKSMTPVQVALLKRWRSYVCKQCGHTMEARTPDPEDW